MPYYEGQTGRHSLLIMQKNAFVMGRRDANPRDLCWLAQGTPFTCWSVRSVANACCLAASWVIKRHQTTRLRNLGVKRRRFFMTSGHGGCHSYGLAFGGKKRVYRRMWLSEEGPLFDRQCALTSLRKTFLRCVAFKALLKQCDEADVRVHYLLMR